MSNDLISRSMLSKKICNKECDVPRFATEVELNAFLLGLNVKQIAVMECLSDTPTSYDVDKVVERLEELEAFNNEKTRCKFTEGYGCAIDEAIEIVKSGGIE